MSKTEKFYPGFKRRVDAFQLFVQKNTREVLTRLKYKMKYEKKLPKNIDVGDFQFIETYEDAFRAWTYNDLVRFNKEEVPLVGFKITTESSISKLNGLYEIGTEEECMKKLFKRLFKLYNNEKTTKDRIRL